MNIIIPRTKKFKSNHLDTYITRIENIEKTKVQQLVNYLLSEEHSNHENSRILSNNNNPDEYLENNQNKINSNSKRKRHIGGKKLKYSNKSITFNIPVDYEVTDINLKNIQSRLVEYIKFMYKNENIDLRDIDIFSNIHDQGNSHINLIIPYLTDNGETIRFIKSQDKFLKVVAKEFTNIVDNELNTNIQTYKTRYDQIEELNETYLNYDKLTLEDISELKKKVKDNKLLKRSYDYLYKVINGGNQIKTIQRLANTAKAMGKSEKVTKEEYDLFLKHLRLSGFMEKLSEEGKTIIKDSIKKRK